MSPVEMGWRLHDQVLHRTWARHQVRPGEAVTAVARRVGPGFPSLLPSDAANGVAPEAAEALIRAADQLLQGTGELLGVRRTDLAAPDWFVDPITGVRAPQGRYAFRIDHRSEAETGNVKQLWELSRLQHLTVLAGARFLTGDDTYAEATARQLESWWRENPFLSGVHWTSGIEVGLRLITWTWVRRLLEGWTGASALFEDNERAVSQIYWHQRYLSSLRSRGSSANNHVVAEAAGQLVACFAFPWFTESPRWCRRAAALLEDELRRNTFPSGLNREQASDYHGFVAELGLVAAVEAAAAGQPLPTPTWELLCRMVDAAAAFLDAAGRAPRQGDGDEGRAVMLDPPTANRWGSLLASGAALFGPQPWWPAHPSGVASTLFGALAPGRSVVWGRPSRRPSHFADAGLTLLRSAAGAEPEIWCRCDGGPHGYLSIAGHAHADALSIEVRHDGVDVLADPGTYCYHGEPEWRHYFRSTLAHSTIELGGRDQSQSGGPFLWLRQAQTMAVEVVTDDSGDPEGWSAEHCGYEVLDPPATHRRRVHLDRRGSRLDIADRVVTAGRHVLRMGFHLGPSVRAEFEGRVARLRWPTRGGAGSAHLSLPEELSWEMHRGEVQPVLGWYSAAFGLKEPTTVILGVGRCSPDLGELRTSLRFDTEVRDRSRLSETAQETA
jgi:uncharacterized heparinase superfamily protein